VSKQDVYQVGLIPKRTYTEVPLYFFVNLRFSGLEEKTYFVFFYCLKIMMRNEGTGIETTEIYVIIFGSSKET
jgi:hypothetical protein